MFPLNFRNLLDLSRTRRTQPFNYNSCVTKFKTKLQKVTRTIMKLKVPCIMLSFYQAASHLINARSQSVLLSNWSEVKKGQTDMFIYLPDPKKIRRVCMEFSEYNRLTSQRPLFHWFIGSWSMRKLFTGGNKARSGAMLYQAALKWILRHAINAKETLISQR